MTQPPTITAAELAARIGGTLVGDGARRVRDVATLKDAGPESLAWLGSAAYLKDLADSQAGVVLVPPDCPVPPGRTAIRVADPDTAMCAALEALAPPREPVPPGSDPAARVAPTATVDGACIGPFVYVGPHARIGPETQLHAGVYIGAHCEIGRGCVLWSNVVVREYTTLGDRVIIHPNATLGADGFGYRQRGGRHVKIPQIGRVVVEDDVEIGANACIDRARSGVTRIGRGTKIDNLVQIGHNVQVGEDCVIVAQCGISGSATLGRHVIMGGQAGVGDHVRIGDDVVLAARAAGMHDLAPGKVYRGNPCIEHVAFGRQAVAVRRLPDTIKELRALIRRVEQLEAAANHRARD